MRTILDNILAVNPQNTSWLVLVVGIGCWLAMWFVLVIDVAKRPRSAFWKGSWLVFVSVPLIGGVLYSLAELLTADWRAAFAWRQHDRKAKKGGKG